MREFVEHAAAQLGITLQFEGSGEHEVGCVAVVSGERAACRVGDVIVRGDSRYFRPTEVDSLVKRAGYQAYDHHE